MSASWRRLDGDTLLGVVVLLVGIVVLIAVADYPELPGGRVGPALFPRILGTLAIIFGGSLVLQSRVGKGEGADDTGDAAAPTPPDDAAPALTEFADWRVALPNALLVLAALPLYILLSEHAGFVATAGVITLMLMLRLGVRPVRAFATSLIAVLIVNYAFGEVLGVPLPQVW